MIVLRQKVQGGIMTAPREFAILEWSTLESCPKFREMSWKSRYVFIYIWCYCAKERTERTYWPTPDHLVTQIRLWCDCPASVVRRSLKEIFAAGLAAMSGKYLLVRGVREGHAALRNWGHKLSTAELKLFADTEVTAEREAAAAPAKEKPASRRSDAPAGHPVNSRSSADEGKFSGPSTSVPRQSTAADTKGLEGIRSGSRDDRNGSEAEGDVKDIVGKLLEPRVNDAPKASAYLSNSPQESGEKARETTIPPYAGRNAAGEWQTPSNGSAPSSPLATAQPACGQSPCASTVTLDPNVASEKCSPVNRLGGIIRDANDEVAVRRLIQSLSETYLMPRGGTGRAMREKLIRSWFAFRSQVALREVIDAGKEKLLTAVYFALYHSREDAAGALYTYAVKQAIPEGHERECFRGVQHILESPDAA
jgi:hypothetical protein